MVLLSPKNGFLSRGVRILFLFMTLLVLVPLGAQTASAASFTPNTSQLVGNWSINANGYAGTLQITSLSSAGVIYGTILGDPLVGTYNANTGALAFLRLETSDFSYYQIYTGTVSGTGISGTFHEFFHGLNASSNWTSYTWNATFSSALANTPLPAPNTVWNGTAIGYADSSASWNMDTIPHVV